LAIGIVYDQDLIWSKGFGYADLETQQEVTTQTLFRIASISKLFTSMAIMQLRDAGKLQLDDPLRRHLKWFTIKNDFADGPEITIRQVLTHSAGLPREAAFPYWTDHVFPSREEMIKALPGQEMIFEPETRWKYSNLGMALLGEVISRVSGMSYEDYV
jgi:CubicO group peptidase (beta-lactamase class C family)